MKTETYFCDVCGRELKTPAVIRAHLDNYVGAINLGQDFNVRITITLDKIAGAYADFCCDCTRSVLKNATVLYGEIGGTLRIATNKKEG
jgi:hypothetical protein